MKRRIFALVPICLTFIFTVLTACDAPAQQSKGTEEPIEPSVSVSNLPDNSVTGSPAPGEPKPGYMTVDYTRRQAEAPGDCLPDLQAYSNGLFWREGITVETDEVTGALRQSVFYKSDSGSESEQVLSAYIALLEDPRFHLETAKSRWLIVESGGDSSYGTCYNYTGQDDLEHSQTVGFWDKSKTPCDVNLTEYQNLLSTSVKLIYPMEMQVLETEDRYPGLVKADWLSQDTSGTYAVQYAYEDGFDVFTIKGYGASGDKLTIKLYEDFYSTGDVFAAEDFTNTASTALTQMAVICEEITNNTYETISPSADEAANLFPSAQVRVLEKTDALVRLTFDVAFHSDDGAGITYEIQGGLAVDKSALSSLNTQGTNDGKIKVKCSVCGGDGDCTHCGGDGVTIANQKCTFCNGTGDCWGCMGLGWTNN